MNAWPTVTLGEVLRRSERIIRLDPESNYKEVTVRMNGRGVVERRQVQGVEIATDRRYQAKSGQFIISRIDARNGASGLIPDELDGAVVTNDFPLFDIDNDRLDAAFFGWMSKTASFVELCRRASEGTTNRIRLSEDRFKTLDIPLPPLDVQRRIVARLGSLAEKVKQVVEHLDAVERDADHLVALRFHDAIAEVPSRPMAEIAPLVRREQSIAFDGNYPELGVRSFGKGTFHKPPLSGAEVGSKRLYRIEPGDLVFSNVFAWEGAIAIAQPEDAGRFGSHRFITCQADPAITTADFLRYYFLSDEGLRKVGEASPGGAGRNRTLGLEKLMALEVPIPPLAAQQSFDRLYAEVSELKTKHASIRVANSALLPSILSRAFKGGPS